MPTNNENKYLCALSRLKSDDENKLLIQVRLSPLSLDLLEDLMKKMEWNLATAINSCITHATSLSENLGFNNFNDFSLSDDFELLELDLSIKNENRMSNLAEKNNFEFNGRFISYVLIESIQIFLNVLLNNNGAKNGKG